MNGCYLWAPKKKSPQHMERGSPFGNKHSLRQPGSVLLNVKQLHVFFLGPWMETSPFVCEPSQDG